MKHASSTTIEKLSALLAEIRSIPGIIEKKPGVYYRKSKAFLHFHEDGDSIFADVRFSGKNFERLPCTTKREQKTLLCAIQRSAQ